jgi:hypothetical protein
MTNRVWVDAVSATTKRDILECDACYRHDYEYVLCGWHENLVAAFAIVQTTYGTMIEEPDDV